MTVLNDFPELPAVMAQWKQFKDNRKFVASTSTTIKENHTVVDDAILTKRHELIK